MNQELANRAGVIEKRELGIDVTHHFDKVSRSNSEFERILDIVSWKQQPVFPRPGRMAWRIFDQKPELTDGHVRSMEAAKMKGVGIYNPSIDGKHRAPIYHSTSDQPFQPSNQPLLNFITYPHFGINNEGEYGFAFGKPSPIGGIEYERALNEYNCAVNLLKHDVSAIVPLAVVKYNSLPKFHGHDLGAVVCISPSQYPHRLGEIQHGAALRPGLDTSRDEFCRRLFETFEIDGDPFAEVTRLQLLKQIAFGAGRLINQFSRSGLFRYSSELQNFEYDFSRRQLVLTDLDSTLFLTSLPPKLQRLQVMRDFGSLMYHFMVGFATPLALGHYTIKNLIASDPISDLISGYFSTEVDSRVKSISLLLWSIFVPHFALLNRHRDKIDSEWSFERRRSYKMEHDLFYIAAMTILYPHFCENSISKMYPDDTLTQEQMVAKARKYLGPRFEYFEYLVNLSASYLDVEQFRIS